MAGAIKDFFNLNKNRDYKEPHWTCPKCKTQNPLGSPFCLKCAQEEELAEEQREKVRLEMDNNPLVSTLVQALNLYLQAGQIPSREVAEEAKQLGIVINAPQEIALVPVRELDRLADRFVNNHRLMATGSGALLGFPGGALMIATIPADISTLAYYSFRSISGIAQSYGYETRSEEGRAIALLLFAGATGLETITVAGSQVLLSNLTKNVLTKPYRDLILKRVINEVAKDLGLNVAKRGLSRFVPVLGSVVGGTANYFFVTNVTDRAKNYYRMRLLESRSAPDEPGEENPI
ncbi:MAG TPA: EcsC family protein [Chloroflexia bacterium]|nr:EcsC family protein [Chloroflexia bacterium]